METDLLKALDDAERRLVLSKMTRRSFRKGATLFFEGDVGDSLMIVDRGRVAVRVSTPDGDVATLVVLSSGDCFGELALVSDASVRTASVVALESVEVRVLYRHDFEDLRRRHPAVERFLVDLMASQVRRLSHQVLDAYYVPADKRVVRRAADLARLYASDALGGRIDIPMRQEDLALMAGTTRPTANRVLKQLEDDGVLVLQRGCTIVTDLAELERRAR